MSIDKKIIITDTNIITDLDNAKVLDKFVKLDNVYISDMVKNDEINSKTGNLSIISEFKVIESTAEQLKEINLLSKKVTQLSQYDLINYVIAKNNDYILATGDNNLKKYAESNGVVVIRTLRIIRIMREKSIITLGQEKEAYNLLLKCKNTRIPDELILERLKEFV